MDIRVRLDKFLKETRIIPRRTIAKEVVDNGNVLVNDKIAKPCTNLNDGDIIKIYIKGTLLIVKAIFKITPKRVFVSAELLDKKVEDFPKC